MYALPSVSALKPPALSLRMCGGSLYPQEGCALARHGREGQDKDTNDFGVCVAGPVRSLHAFVCPPPRPSDLEEGGRGIERKVEVDGAIDK